jgi:hypothetical protein
MRNLPDHICMLTLRQAPYGQRAMPAHQRALTADQKAQILRPTRHGDSLRSKRSGEGCRATTNNQNGRLRKACGAIGRPKRSRRRSPKAGFGSITHVFQRIGSWALRIKPSSSEPTPRLDRLARFGRCCAPIDAVTTLQHGALSPFGLKVRIATKQGWIPASKRASSHHLCAGKQRRG